MEWIAEHCYSLLWGGAVLLMAIFYLRHRKRIRSFLLGSISGLAALVLLHIFGGILGFTPSLCLANLLISVLLGVPGVALIFLTGTIMA